MTCGRLELEGAGAGLEGSSRRPLASLLRVPRCPVFTATISGICACVTGGLPMCPRRCQPSSTEIISSSSISFMTPPKCSSPGWYHVCRCAFPCVWPLLLLPRLAAAVPPCCALAPWPLPPPLLLRPPPLAALRPHTALAAAEDELACRQKSFLTPEPTASDRVHVSSGLQLGCLRLSELAGGV